MRKYVICLTLCAMIFALCWPVWAQQQEKLPRIGFVSETGDPFAGTPNFEAFRQGLRDLGYVEGKNILIDFRSVEGKPDRIPGIVAELVQLKVDAIVSQPTSGIRAAKQATKTIPIVMVTVQDPVATGLIDTLERPGGNITGLIRLTVELSGQRLDLLKEMVPRISRVGVLWDADGSGVGFKGYEASARALNIQLQSLEVRGPKPELESAFETATKGSVDALITVTGGLLNRYAKPIAHLALKTRLPSLFERTPYVDAGGLMSYAPNDADSYRRAAVFVDKILQGAKPADLPVEQPTKFELVINLKTAKQIGLAIPPNVLVRADKVIK